MGILVNKSKLISSDLSSPGNYTMSPSNIFPLYFMSVYLVILTDSKLCKVEIVVWVSFISYYQKKKYIKMVFGSLSPAW